MSLRLARNLSAVALLALAPNLAACGSDDGTGSNTDDVTDVKHTDVKKQAIGNCWVYATAGWAESLHLTHTGVELDISESYISYWHWFEQIANGPPGEQALASMSGSEVSTGGWYGVAAELMLRYGVMDEGGFIPEEAEAARSQRQSDALAAINKSLKDGVLSDPNNRRNPELVRQELDKAWQLTPEVIATLNSVFGSDVSRTLYEAGIDIPADSTLRYINTIEVGNGITLADAVGQPASSWNVKDRKGQYAWNEIDYPSSESQRRAFLRDAQVALHAGMPVIMTWFVDFAAMGSDSAFRAPPEEPGRQGWHMTAIEDYQINNVPGFGTLEAGVVVEDPAALEAALADEAQIEFIRIKNSWGTSLSPDTNLDEFRGYHDLYMAYLNGPIKECKKVGDDKCGKTVNQEGLGGLVLPPPGFTTAQQGATGTCGQLCSEGPAMKEDNECGGDTGACIALVCENDAFCCNEETGSWDSQCVSEAADWCGLSCQ